MASSAACPGLSTTRCGSVHLDGDAEVARIGAPRGPAVGEGVAGPVVDDLPVLVHVPALAAARPHRVVEPPLQGAVEDALHVGPYVDVLRTGQGPYAADDVVELRLQHVDD